MCDMVTIVDDVSVVSLSCKCPLQKWLSGLRADLPQTCFLGCIECMICSLLLPVISLSVTWLKSTSLCKNG